MRHIQKPEFQSKKGSSYLENNLPTAFSANLSYAGQW